ncbi:MAG TPA: tetraacyldisaccharide 4'-kinase [Fluviicoccus sp.]|nr:tetraacyldisaccharide 4'-kinase [Fluviicoccus sp.]
MIRERLVRDWYHGGWLPVLLMPLTALFWLIATLRRLVYRSGLIPIKRFPVPVIVIGNISIGGTGKTPLTLHLVQLLKEAGYRPAIVSRGYGGRSDHYPLLLGSETRAEESGDEPLLIYRETGVPVVVDPRRPRAVELLVQRGLCDIVISDDGLQHYALHRDLELLVVDGERGLGNGWMLPSGPLREPASRAASVDAVVINGGSGLNLPLRQAPVFRFCLKPGKLLPVGPADKACTAPQAGQVHAVAGIGNPGRFFTTLEACGFAVIPHAFADHHQFRPEDLEFEDHLPIVMTTKDAVKCREFAKPDVWQLPVAVEADPALEDRILAFAARYREKRVHAG